MYSRRARDLASLADDSSLFAGPAVEKLDQLNTELKPLTEHYDVVVANPPYMGGKNMNLWFSDWVKSNYADVKGDMFSCFIVRNLAFGSDHAQLGFMTPYVWMFIGTYEKLRKLIIEQHTITSLIQLEYSGFAGATVPICTFTLQKGNLPDYKGGYIRLSDFVGADNQAPRALEALANPDCGWFYRRNADAFEAIPGSPIAYWASDGMVRAFQHHPALQDDAGIPQNGLDTCDVERFVRYWYEVGKAAIDFHHSCGEPQSHSKWFPYAKGGNFRKWFGNNDRIVNWENDGEEIRNFKDEQGKLRSRPQNIDDYFKPIITWTAISSGAPSMRLNRTEYTVAAERR